MLSGSLGPYWLMYRQHKSYIFGELRGEIMERSHQTRPEGNGRANALHRNLRANFGAWLLLD